MSDNLACLVLAGCKQEFFEDFKKDWIAEAKENKIASFFVDAPETDDEESKCEELSEELKAIIDAAIDGQAKKVMKIVEVFIFGRVQNKQNILTKISFEAIGLENKESETNLCVNISKKQFKALTKYAMKAFKDYRWLHSKAYKE